MARRPRVAPGGYPLHVLNRAAGRIRLLNSDADFLAFERLLVEAHARHPIAIYSYCLMGNHWHLVVHPERDGQVTAFFKWLTHAHAMRWRTAKKTVGHGPLYQGRFKSFLIEEDLHLLSVCRYVERNALSAGLVKRAQDWRWSSLFVRQHGTKEMKGILSPWPVDRPLDWVRQVNAPLTAKEMDALKPSLQRGRPYGDSDWVAKTTGNLGLIHTVRREGRPEKKVIGGN